MRRAQDGDRLVYERLLSEVTAELRGFIAARLPHAEWVEDVVQETLLSLHRDRHTYDPSRPFASWLYAIARHRLIDFSRRRRRTRAWEQTGALEEPSSAVAPAPELGGTPFSVEGLQRAWRKLSRQQQQIIQLLRFEGLSVREAAESTGISESAVKVSAHRGYRVLRQALGRQSEAD